MRVRSFCATLFVSMFVACATLPPAHPPSPPSVGDSSPTPFAESLTVRGPDGSLPAGVSAWFTPDDGSGTVLGVINGGRVAFTFAAGVHLGWGGTLGVVAPGLDEWDGRANTNLSGELCPCTPPSGAAVDEVHLVASLPPPPTRDQLLHAKVSMYGTTCDVPELGGVIPWWDPGAQAVSAAERQAIYGCKRAAGDTGIIIGSGEYDGILYDEPDNPYQVAIHPYDIAARVVEGAKAGFSSKIFLDGDGAQMQRAFDEFPIIYNKLLHGGPNGEDLNRYVQYVPGWDGVFYSCTDPECWTPATIQRWAAMARGMCSYCVLALEFNTGHIPFGEGDSDYRAGGGMKDFDSVLIEFDFNLHNDNTWQIVSRLIGPAYNKPSDDPNGPAPWYLAQPTVRGPWGVECFEPPTYLWVRGRITAAQAVADRAYLVGIGCPVVD